MAADQADIRADVLTLLQNFRGTDPLRELFWSRLNYDRENKPIGRRKWPESVAEILVDDPTLLASGGKDNDFKVLYARLAKDRLSLSDERIVTSRLLKDHPYGLFVFSDRNQTNWHFLHRGRHKRALRNRLDQSKARAATVRNPTRRNCCVFNNLKPSPRKPPIPQNPGHTFRQLSSPP
jgi:hypothetical protein